MGHDEECQCKKCNTCFHCGKELGKGRNDCPHCLNEDELYSNIGKCIHCGREVEEDRECCPNCFKAKIKRKL